MHFLFRTEHAQSIFEGGGSGHCGQLPLRTLLPGTLQGGCSGLRSTWFWSCCCQGTAGIQVMGTANRFISLKNLKKPAPHTMPLKKRPSPPKLPHSTGAVTTSGHPHSELIQRLVDFSSVTSVVSTYVSLSPLD